MKVERKQQRREREGDGERRSMRGREEGRKTGEILVGCSTNMDEGHL